MNFTPLHDFILIKQTEAKKTTASGLILPSDEQEKPNQGKVVAVGPGKAKKDGTLRPTLVQKDDLVLFGKYHSGETIELNGVEHIILKEADILAKIIE
jgi:chaperonin GroES